jgi:hypothetical protein
MPRKKKDLNINIDTKNIDINITRKDGVLDAKLDTKNLDIHVTKDEENLNIEVESNEKVAEKLSKALSNFARVITKKRG